MYDESYVTKQYVCTCLWDRAVGKSENPEVPVLFGGHNVPLIDIELTDPPN